jgi:hypothetical protein
MTAPCAILAADAVTSLGAGLEETWAQMLRLTCGIRAMARYPHGRYRGNYAAEISSTVEDGLRERPGGAGLDLA